MGGAGSRLGKRGRSQQTCGTQTPEEGSAQALSRSAPVDASTQTADVPDREEGGGLCVVCLSDERQAVFSCGHVCVCMACSTQVSACPLCRARTGRVRRVFL